MRSVRGERSYSVVIPAFNAERTLGAVLAALAEQDPKPAEVVVVDDGSTDATAEIAEAHGARVVPGSGAGLRGRSAQPRLGCGDR